MLIVQQRCLLVICLFHRWACRARLSACIGMHDIKLSIENAVSAFMLLVGKGIRSIKLKVIVIIIIIVTRSV